jgi:tetratricopeptide (TPR) repeat protein
VPKPSPAKPPGTAQTNLSADRTPAPPDLPAGRLADPPAWAPAAFAVLLTAAVYARTAGFDFVDLDDPTYVSGNPDVLGGLSLQGLRWAFSFDTGTYWHPLTWLSLMLDQSLYDGWAGGFHLTNVALHCANVALLYALALRWCARRAGAKWIALAVTLAFGLHPAHVESVAWITERKDVLFLFFGLICLHCHTGRIARGKTNFVSMLPALTAYAASLLSKPMLVTLPALLLLLDFWPFRRLAWQGLHAAQPRLRALLMEKIPYLFFASCATVTTLLSHPESNSVIRASPGLKLANAAAALLDYLRLLVWPVGLAVVYPFPQIPPLTRAAAAVVVATVFTVIILRQLGRQPHLTVGWFWFLFTLVPVLMPPEVGLHVAYADRWAYLPFIGLYLAAMPTVAEVLGRIATQRRRQLTAVVLLTALCSLTAVPAMIQLRWWQDAPSLYDRALAVTEDSYMIMNNQAVLKMRAGDYAEAEKWLRRSLLAAPRYVQALSNMGLVCANQGRFAEAIGYLDAALAHDGASKENKAEDHYYMGFCLAQLGRLAEAESHYKETLRFRPDSPLALNDLGNIAQLRGDATLAQAYFQQALLLAPDYRAARDNLLRLREREEWNRKRRRGNARP